MPDHRFLLIIGLVTVDSLHFAFARLLLPHLAPSVGAMYVLIVATVEVLVVSLVCARSIPALTWKRFRIFFVIGLLVGGSTYIDYEAMAFIDPGTAALLFQASIFFGIALGIWLLKESLTSFQTVGTLLAVSGVVAITFHPGDYMRIGALLIFISAFMYSLHAVIAKRYGSSMDFFDFFFFRLLFTSIVLILFCFAKQELVWPPKDTWLLLIVVGTVDVVISRAFYYLAMRQLTVSMLSVSLTLSPALAVVWAVFFFDAFFTAKQIIGGILVLMGVLLALVRSSTSRAQLKHKESVAKI